MPVQQLTAQTLTAQLLPCPYSICPYFGTELRIRFQTMSWTTISPSIKCKIAHLGLITQTIGVDLVDQTLSITLSPIFSVDSQSTLLLVLLCWRALFELVGWFLLLGTTCGVFPSFLPHTGYLRLDRGSNLVGFCLCSGLCSKNRTPSKIDRPLFSSFFFPLVGRYQVPTYS